MLKPLGEKSLMGNGIFSQYHLINYLFLSKGKREPLKGRLTLYKVIKRIVNNGTH